VNFSSLSGLSTLNWLRARFSIAAVRVCSPPPGAHSPEMETIMTIRSRTLPAIAAVLALATAGCAMTPSASDFATTVSAAGRISGDYERDAVRKPADVLAFTQSRLRPDRVRDGSRRRLLHRTPVAGRGRRPARSSCRLRKSSKRFYKDPLAARLKDNRLANVTVSWSPFDKLDAADASVDVVTWFQGPHETVLRQGHAAAP
jgi:hypothetical protein